MQARMKHISVVEDIRQALQDFITPELKAIAVRMDSLERRQDTFEKTVESRLSNQDKLAEARHNEILANFETMRINLQLHARLERLESQQSPTPQ
jgi:hypothetical protein